PSQALAARTRLNVIFASRRAPRTTGRRVSTATLSDAGDCAARTSGSQMFGFGPRNARTIVLTNLTLVPEGWLITRKCTSGPHLLAGEHDDLVSACTVSVVEPVLFAAF